MKRTVTVFTVVLPVVLAAGMAYAGTLDKVKDWFTWNAAAYIITGLLAVGVIGESVILGKIIRTLKEGGEFLTVLGDAVEDRKLGSDELNTIAKEARDVFDVWKPTPERYRVE